MKKLAAGILALCMLGTGFGAKAITIISSNVTFLVNDPGLFSPVCEVSTTVQIIRGSDDDFFFLNDSYFMGVTDATGTVGVNNVGAPNPAQQRAVQVGVTTTGLGFIDRTDLATPKYLTVWEGVEDPLSPGSFIPGAILFQEQIPQALIQANCQGSNQAPIADAGTDQLQVVPGSSVTLNGSGSSDPDNDALTYLWMQLSGPTVTLSDPSSPTPTFVAPGGTGGAPLIFQLVVNDGTTSSVADTVSIGVQDNVLAARSAIAGFLPERATLLLAQQPDIQRRIDRLQGRSSGQATMAGSSHNPDRLPVSMEINGGQATVRSSLRQGNPDSRLDVWIEGSRSDFRFGAREGSLTLAYVGADYTFGNTALVGIMGQYDIMDYKAAVTQGVTGGEGWMIGPYATVRLAGDIFLDVRAATGESRNQIRPFGTYEDRFNTRRNLLSASLLGEHDISSGIILRTDASVHYLQETQNSYVDSLGSVIPGADFEFGQVSAAPRVMMSHDLSRNWIIRPYLEARGIYSFGDDGGTLGGETTRLRGEAGFDLFSLQGHRVSLSGYYDGIGVASYRATGVRLTASLTF